MSKHLTAKMGILVAAGTTVAQLHELLKTEITATGWQVAGESNVDGDRYLDLIPPASQTIGNDMGREVVRLEATDTAIQMRSYVASSSGRGPAYRLTVASNTTGEIGVQIGESVISVTGTGDFENNQQALYEALVASTDPEAQKYTFTAFIEGSTLYTIAVAKGPDAQPITTPSGSSSSITTIANAYTADAPSVYLTPVIKTNIDLAEGFMYYLSVFERSLLLATKTTSGFFGPVAASYHNNASAVQQTPAMCVPVELFTVDLATLSSSNTTTKCYSAHFWSVLANNSLTGNHVPAYDAAVRKYLLLGGIEDAVSKAWGSSGVPSYTLSPLHGGNASAAIWEDVTGQDASILSTGINSVRSSSNSSFALAPEYTNTDLMVFVGTAASESLQFTKHDERSSLSAALTDSADTVQVADASAFVDAGVAIIGTGEAMEAVEYTGKSGNSLTGVTRGQYGTTAQAFDSGAEVSPALWFLIANRAAMLAGTERPA